MYRRANGMDTYGEENYRSANYIAQGFKQSDHLGVGLNTRPRAIPVGTLDDFASRMHRRATVVNLQTTFGSDLSLPTNLSTSNLSPAGILRSEKVTTPRPRACSSPLGPASGGKG